MNEVDTGKLIKAIEDQTFVLSVIAKELAILAENHGTSCGRQVAGVLINEMEDFLRKRDEEKENS